MSRKRTGEKIQWRARARTWVGRIRMDDGSRSPWIDMCTDDPKLAQDRYDRWLEGGDIPSQAGKELFAAAAERIVEKQRERGEKGAKDRATRVRSYALPILGQIEVARIEPHHVASVLDSMCARGKLSGYILKMRSDISRILSTLRREGAVLHNVALGVELPEDAQVDDRPRIVLTDDEVLRFRRRGFATELDMMALVARDLAGHRTSDLHAFSWEDCDRVAWRSAKVRRPKTDGQRGRDSDGRRAAERGGRKRGPRAYEKVTHGIPATVREHLIDWWVAHGSPAAGPVFPVRKGPRVGQYKASNISYAQPLRDALWSEGIVRPLPGFETAVGDARRNFCALQVDTADTRAVDFHSFRRAYVTALASAGVSLQDAMDATGHAQATTSHAYRGPRFIETPVGALPGGAALPSSPTPAPEPSPNQATGQAAPIAPGPMSPDMAALITALAAGVAQQLVATAAKAPGAPLTPIDPDSGSKAGVTKLRGIAGGKK
jgi:hypothetical protein